LLLGRATSNTILIYIKEWFEPLDIKKNESKEDNHSIPDNCLEKCSKHMPFFHIGGYDMG